MAEWFGQTLNFCISAWNDLVATDRMLIIIAAAVILSFATSDIITNLLGRKKKQDLGTLRKNTHKKARGIRFGKMERKVVYSPTESEGHVAVVGGSGTGKTSAMLIPTLRSWTGHFFTIDISGDIRRNVDVPDGLTYAPSDPKTIPYNIFGTIDGLSDDTAKDEALAQLAYLLMPTSILADDASSYFSSEGRKILIAALTAFYHGGMDFADICEKIVSSSWQELFTAIDETKYQPAILFINSFQGNNEKNTAGCKQACDAAVTLFATNGSVKHSVRRPKGSEHAITPPSLEECSIFVVIEDAKLKLYSPLLHIITAQTLEYLSSRTVTNDSMTILLALDEFVSLGHLEITEALRKLRKRKVRIMVLTQSIADLDMMYGRLERMSMMANFKYVAVLSANDSDTQEYLARLAGRHEVQSTSVSISARSTTRTHSKSKDYIIDPHEFSHLGNHIILIHDRGVLRLKKDFYYKH